MAEEVEADQGEQGKPNIEPEPSSDKTLSHDQKGDFDDLKVNAIDPSNIQDDPADARFGKPAFLSWTLKKDEQGEEYLEAVGKDQKVYKIVSDEEPEPKKKGKIVIE